MAASAGDYDALDGCPTVQARFAFAAIDAMLHLKETRLAFGAYVI